MAVLVAVVLLRRHGRFAWWELPVVWLLVAAAVLSGVLWNRQLLPYGTDLVPLYLQQTALFLGFLALPAVTAAGAGVAEITVRATLAATSGAQRLTRPAAAYTVLAVVGLLRLAQAGWQLINADPVAEGLPAVLIAAGLAALLTAVGWLLVQLSRRLEGRPLVVSKLSEELGAVGLPVAAALIAVVLPVQISTAVLQVLQGLGVTGTLPHGLTALTSAAALHIAPYRALVATMLLLLAVHEARRGRTGRSLLLGLVGVMLLALARRLLLGDQIPSPLSPDALNLVTSAVVAVAVGTWLVRRVLSPARAVAASGVLVLSALFAYRDVVADPLTALLGAPAVALVMIGLVWNLLTSAEWGNSDSPRWPRPTRTLLLLTNALLTMTALAYGALVRDPSSTSFDDFAALGDLVLGTGLLAAAVLALLEAARRNLPVN